MNPFDFDKDGEEDFHERPEHILRQKDPARYVAERHARHAKREVERKVSGCVFSVVFVLVFVVIVAAVLAYVYFEFEASRDGASGGDGETVTASSGKELGPFEPTTWSGSEPLVCAGNERMSVRDASGDVAEGTAVVAKGNCQLLLENVSASGKVALETAGNAHVIVRKGALSGPTAIEAGGLSHVELHGTTVEGAVEKSGQANVIDVSAAEGSSE